MAQARSSWVRSPEPTSSMTLFTAFHLGIPCDSSSSPSIVILTPQRRGLVYARAARTDGRRGTDCRMLTRGILDLERESSLDEVLAALELPVRRFQAELRSGGVEVLDQSVNGVWVTLMPTVPRRAQRSPNPWESAVFLAGRARNQARQSYRNQAGTRIGQTQQVSLHRGRRSVDNKSRPFTLAW
jgi:hypothetical protein